MNRLPLFLAVSVIAAAGGGCSSPPGSTEARPLARVQVMHAAQYAAREFPSLDVIGRGGVARRASTPAGRLLSHSEVVLEVRGSGDDVTAFGERFCTELGVQMGGRRQDAIGGFQQGRCDWHAERGGAMAWLSIPVPDSGTSGARFVVVMDEW
jgi:hypothetical protein